MSQLPPYGTPQYAPPRSNGLAIASLVLGIISLLLFCLWYVSIPCAVIAIILGVVARAKAKSGEASGGGMATAGIVCGGVGALLCIALYAAVLIGIAKFGPQIQNKLNQIQAQQMQYLQQAQKALQATQPSMNATQESP